MYNFALIGKKLGHSFSKRYFEEEIAVNCAPQLQGQPSISYGLLEMPSLESLREVVAEHHLDGFNVTVPYKEAIIPLLDELDPAAREIGAVNCVKVRYASTKDSCGVCTPARACALIPQPSALSPHNIYLKGYNTDAPAFLETLKKKLKSSKVQKFKSSKFKIQNSKFVSPFTIHNSQFTIHNSLILGTGGAAKAVAWALRQMQIPYQFVSRHPELHPYSISYNEAEKQFTIHHSKFKIQNSKFKILINATPVGMWPEIDVSPWARPDLLNEHTLCYDLIYNPSPTLFLQQAAQQGATTIDGLQMLHRQADLSYQIWSD